MKYKATSLLKVLPLAILFLGLSFFNLSYRNQAGEVSLTLTELNANATMMSESCGDRCDSEWNRNVDKTWDRGRDGMGDCLTSAAFDNAAAYLPGSGVLPVDAYLQFSTAWGLITDSLPEAYACLDFIQSVMDNDISQCIDVYDDCRSQC